MFELVATVVLVGLVVVGFGAWDGRAHEQRLREVWTDDLAGAWPRDEAAEAGVPIAAYLKARLDLVCWALQWSARERSYRVFWPAANLVGSHCQTVRNGFVMALVTVPQLAPMLRPVPPPATRPWRTRTLRGLAVCGLALHHLLFSAGERWALGVWVLRVQLRAIVVLYWVAGGLRWSALVQALSEDLATIERALVEHLDAVLATAALVGVPLDQIRDCILDAMEYGVGRGRRRA